MNLAGSEHRNATTAPKSSGRPSSPVGTDRAALERARYLAVYGIDLDDRSPYDLVLDSTNVTAADLADQVVEQARRTFG